MKKTWIRVFLWGGVGLSVLCLVAVAISAISNRFLPEPPETLDRLQPIDKTRLAEVYQLHESLGDTVWPGFGQEEIPMMVWNREWSFLTGLDAIPAGWQVVPGDNFRGRVYFRRASVDPQNFAVPVGETWAASLATKSETDEYLIQMFRDMLPPVLETIFPYRLMIQPSEVQISGLIHESFHVYQQLKAPDRLAAAEAVHRLGEAYWAADESMHDDWQVEIDLLAQALQVQDDQQAAELARQFLEQRQLRRINTALTAELIDYERQLEWEEGLAKYVELGIWETAYTSADYQPMLTGDSDFKGYQTFPQRLKQEISQMKRQAGQTGETRFYYTGMAQARLLDGLLPVWKERVLNEGVWLEDLLEEAVAPAG